MYCGMTAWLYGICAGEFIPGAYAIVTCAILGEP